MQKEIMHCKFLREILKLIKGTKNTNGDEDIEAGDDSFKKQFTKAWIPREYLGCNKYNNQRFMEVFNF